MAEDELTAISKEHIVRFRNAMLERQTATGANHHLKVVKMLFRSAKKDGFIVDDPSEFVETVKQKAHEKKRRNPFTVAQIQALLSVADYE